MSPQSNTFIYTDVVTLLSLETQQKMVQMISTQVATLNEVYLTFFNICNELVTYVVLLDSCKELQNPV